jgi:hypothetical protein
MDNDFFIPLLVTLVTAMAIGAVYLLTLLMNDGQPEQDNEETLAEYAADTATAPAAQAESEAEAEADGAVAPAEAKQH